MKTEDKKTELYFAVTSCALGQLLLAQSETGVCALFFGDTENLLQQALQQVFPSATLHQDKALLVAALAEVQRLIENPKTTCYLQLDSGGSAFEQQVWQALRQIAPGTTASYSEIAQCIGNPKAVRAVARACARNRLALLIPCHRVVRSDGKLAGYRWGIARKQELLRREAAFKI